ncbi:MAG TPA: hypothetical protein ENJ23_05100 [Bacteroidetes bacterium]|nr:hypothetical protein [Bacteroidota bacterium]
MTQELGKDSANPLTEDLSPAVIRDSRLSHVLEEELFNLTPAVNLLHEANPAVLYRGIRVLRQVGSRQNIRLLRRYQNHASERVRQAVQRKLRPLEISFRRHFFFFQEKMKRYPTYPGYRFGFALTCLRYAQTWVESGRLREYFLRQSLKHLNQLIRLFHPLAKYFYLRGQVLCELDRPRFAIADFERVLQLRPGHGGATYRLIDLYFKTGHPEKSLHLLRQLSAAGLPHPLQPFAVYFEGATAPEEIKDS